MEERGVKKEGISGIGEKSCPCSVYIYVRQTSLTHVVADRQVVCFLFGLIVTFALCVRDE